MVSKKQKLVFEVAQFETFYTWFKYPEVENILFGIRVADFSY